MMKKIGFGSNTNCREHVFVKDNNGEVIKMIRYEVGEGIEKRNDDFAEEVMKQING